MRIDNLQYANWSEKIFRQMREGGVDAGYAIQLFFVSADKGGLNNMVNHSNPEIDEMWSKARVEPDSDVRTDILGQIQDRLMSDVAWAPLLEYRTQWAYSDRLQGLRWYPDNSIRYADLNVAE